MLESVAFWKYFGVVSTLVAAGFGAPIPEEIPVVTAGAMVGHDSQERYHEYTAAAVAGGPGFYLTPHPEGLTRWWIMLPLCIVGVVFGDTVLYGAGRLFGRQLLHSAWVKRKILPDDKRHKIEQNFHDRGVLILMGTRFTPGIRTPVFIMSGVLKMPIGRFLLADALYAIPGVNLLFWLAYLFTDQFVQAIEAVDKHRPLAALAVLSVVIGVVAYRFFTSRQSVDRRPGRDPAVRPAGREDDPRGRAGDREGGHENPGRDRQGHPPAPEGGRLPPAPDRGRTAPGILARRGSGRRAGADGRTDRYPPVTSPRRSAVPRLLAAVAAALLAAPGAASLAAAADPKKPDVLFIAVDDLNDWVGVLGGRADVKTPNIDRLAKRGVVFTKAYCAAPACNPSRTALLTGLQPSTTGVYLNGQSWRPALPDAVTLPHYFRKNGYVVHGGGKIFHGSWNDDRAWDDYHKLGGFPKPETVPHNGIPKTGHFDWGPVDAPDEAMGDFQTAEWAAKVLAGPHDKPLFLAVGFYRPHLPFYAPKKYFDLYPLDTLKLPEVLDTDLEDVPSAGRKMANPGGDHAKVVAAGQWKHAVQAYLACISFTDAMVGKVLDALDESGRAENTIVVLWSDHGWHLGEKQHWRKFALWEEASRVNLTVTAPGVTSPGKTCGRPVGLIDLYPTLVDLCGLPTKDGLDGVSLRPLLADPAAKWDRPALTTHGRNNHALRSERYRYVRYADGSEELYDHDADPREWTNLATEPGMAAVKAGLAEHLPRTNAPNAAAGKRNEK